MKKLKCPVCKLEFEENCEYVDIGVGFQQVTPNQCPNYDWYEGQKDENSSGGYGEGEL